VLAAKLYQAAGVAVPDVKLVTVQDKLGIASGMIDGLQKLPSDAREIKGAMEGFAVDAWLANWDVVGLLRDNLLADPHGQAVRIDVGGALLYRAQGEPKGPAFGYTVGELDTLTDGTNPQASELFGNITHAELATGIRKVRSVPDAAIQALCMEHGSGNRAQKQRLAKLLIARKAYLASLLNSA